MWTWLPKSHGTIKSFHETRCDVRNGLLTSHSSTERSETCTMLFFYFQISVWIEPVGCFIYGIPNSCNTLIVYWNIGLSHLLLQNWWMHYHLTNTNVHMIKVWSAAPTSEMLAHHNKLEQRNHLVDIQDCRHLRLFRGQQQQLTTTLFSFRTQNEGELLLLLNQQH